MLIPGEFAATHNVYLSASSEDVTNGSAGALVGDNISAIGGVHVGQFPDDPAVENAGTVRWNVANNALEVSSGTDWQTLQTGAGSGSGSVFIRWGNATAPEGTTLLYSGFGYANHYTLNAPAHPIVLKSGDPGSGPGGAGYLYPLSTYDDSPPGISAQKDVIAAVCYADGPTATVWGTHSAPDGWVVLYRGYAMGGHHNHNGPADLICVECDTFDDSHPTSYAGAILYGASLAVAASGTDPTHTFIKCAVIMKAP